MACQIPSKEALLGSTLQESYPTSHGTPSSSSPLRSIQNTTQHKIYDQILSENNPCTITRMALGWLGPNVFKSWATKNNFTKQKLWIKTIGSQGPLKVGPATNLTSEPGDVGSICGFHPLWFPEMLPYKSCHIWLFLCIACSWWLLPHLELTSPFLAQGDINLSSANSFEKNFKKSML